LKDPAEKLAVNSKKLLTHYMASAIIRTTKIMGCKPHDQMPHRKVRHLYAGLVPAPIFPPQKREPICRPEMEGT